MNHPSSVTAFVCESVLPCRRSLSSCSRSVLHILNAHHHGFGRGLAGAFCGRSFHGATLSPSRSAAKLASSRAHCPSLLIRPVRSCQPRQKECGRSRLREYTQSWLYRQISPRRARRIHERAQPPSRFRNQSKFLAPLLTNERQDFPIERSELISLDIRRTQTSSSSTGVG